MNYRDRQAAGLAGVVLIGAFAVVAAVLVVTVPLVIVALGAVGRFQGAILERVLTGFAGLTGWQFDYESTAVRLLTAVSFYGGVAAVLYFAFLVSTNIGGLLVVVGASAVIGTLLTICSGIGAPTASQDRLSALKFWD